MKPAARCIVLLAAALLRPGAAAAQQDTTAVFTIDTLTVRAPQALSAVGKTRIQAGRPGITLAEALGDVPGILVLDRHNPALGTRIAMRGFGARAAFGVRGIRLVQDGIPLTMPDGQAALNNIDLTSAGRIDVLRGAASLQHGNAAGGAVLIRSETPAPGFGIEARALAGGYGRAGSDNFARFNANAGGGSEAWRYLVAASRLATDGFREYSRFEQNNLNARLQHFGNGTRTAVTLNVADAPIAQNPGSLPRDSAEQKPAMAWPRNVATGSREKSRQVQGGVVHVRDAGQGSAEVSAYALTRSLENPLPFAWIELDRAVFGARAAWDLPILSFALTAEHQDDARGEFANNQGVRGSQRRNQTDRTFVIAPSVRAQFAITDRLHASGGVRYDRASFKVEDRFFGDGRDDSGQRTMAAFSPAAGITYRLAAGRTLFASVNTAFETPTTTELINAPPPATSGFNSLEPQRARSVEAGFRGRVGVAQLDVAAYHMRITDAIVPFQVPAVEGRDFFRNAGRTRHRGVEASARALLNTWAAVTASYTWSDFVFVDDGNDAAANEGNALPGVPPHRFTLRPEFSARAVVLEAEIEATSGYYADDANTDAAWNDGVVLLHLRARSSRPIGGSRLTPFVAIQNATDRRYNGSVVINAAGGRYFEPAPGRNFYAGLSVQAGRGGPVAR